MDHCGGRLAHLNCALDLDWNLTRQGHKSNRGTRMPARVPEDFDEEVRAAIDYLRLLLEVGSAVHHAEDFDHPGDTVQIAERRFGSRQNLHADLACRRVPLLDGHGAA